MAESPEPRGRAAGREGRRTTKDLQLQECRATATQDSEAKAPRRARLVLKSSWTEFPVAYSHAARWLILRSHPSTALAQNGTEALSTRVLSPASHRSGRSPAG